MDSLKVDATLPECASEQLVTGLLDAIASGQLCVGDRLPSVRGLAAQVEVNPNTVKKAYRDLAKLGVVRGRNGAGVFVTALGPDTARTMRHSETLIVFRRAVESALQAGHEVAALSRELVGLGWSQPVVAGRVR